MPGSICCADHVVERLEGEVRVDGAGAVTDEQRHVVHLARLAGLDHQPGLDARAFAHQVMVHAGGGEQRRDRRVRRVDAAVGKNQEGRALADRRARLPAQLVHGARQPRAALRRREQHRQRHALETRAVDRRFRRASSSLSRIGVLSLIWRQTSGAGSSRLRLRPDAWSSSASPAPRGWRRAAGWSPARTTAGSSRTTAAGGWTAPPARRRGPSSRSASSPFAAIGASRMRRSSCV